MSRIFQLTNLKTDEVKSLDIAGTVLQQGYLLPYRSSSGLFCVL